MHAFEQAHFGYLSTDRYCTLENNAQNGPQPGPETSFDDKRSHQTKLKNFSSINFTTPSPRDWRNELWYTIKIYILPKIQPPSQNNTTPLSLVFDPKSIIKFTCFNLSFLLECVPLLCVRNLLFKEKEPFHGAPGKDG